MLELQNVALQQVKERELLHVKNNEAFEGVQMDLLEERKRILQEKREMQAI